MLRFVGFKRFVESRDQVGLARVLRGFEGVISGGYRFVVSAQFAERGSLVEFGGGITRPEFCSFAQLLQRGGKLAARKQ